jgi:hypothetical protein
MVKNKGHIPDDELYFNFARIHEFRREDASFTNLQVSSEDGFLIVEVLKSNIFSGQFRRYMVFYILRLLKLTANFIERETCFNTVERL